MELEPSPNVAPPPRDRRPHLPEPPPVRLTAVDDVRLPATAGVETLLDQFYLGLLQFVRESGKKEDGVIYRAENVRLIFAVQESVSERADLRPIVVEVPSLQEVEAKIVEREIPYELVRGLLPAQVTLLLQDPAGNWINIVEYRGVR